MKQLLAKYGILAASTLLLAACSGNAQEASDDTSVEDETVEEVEEIENVAEESTEASQLTIKAMYTAPHGNQSFASTFVVMDGDTVFEVIMDEYQFMDGGDWEGVPNDDGAFGEGYAEGLTLVSKRENSDGYSEMMAEHAGATLSYNENLDAIQEFAKGKTISEIEEAITELNELEEEDEIADVVTGATFVDTSGYLQAVVDTANDGTEFESVEIENLDSVELSYSLEAPHGDKAFGIVAVLHDGEKVLGAAMDELQFLDPASFEGVPNSDAKFGENYTDGVVLASKMENDEAYSANMAKADATKAYSENMLAIIDFALGKTADEITAITEELNGLGEDDNIADVVTGATFVDTQGYLEAILKAMEG